jgi:restriction system protein
LSKTVIAEHAWSAALSRFVQEEWRSPTAALVLLADPGNVLGPGPEVGLPARREQPPQVAGVRKQPAGESNILGPVSNGVAIPNYSDLLWPTLRAVVLIGGSGTIEELNARVLEQEHFTEEQQSVPHGDGPGSEIAYRLAWARTYLKGMGAMNNSSRGVWTVTELGRSMDESVVDAAHKIYKQEVRNASRAKRRKGSTDAEGLDGQATEAVDLDDWKERLLDLLLGMSPDAFERLAQRLQREAGFISTNVTGRSGDGGIDGLGVYRLSLVSFPVFFQCKRYRGSVGPSAVRDFRGAMAGRGDKGLLITTGSFTSDAKAEATRDGAPPIDLIDGDRLGDLLKQYGLGVRVTTKTIEEVEIDPGFFTIT